MAAAAAAVYFGAAIVVQTPVAEETLPIAYQHCQNIRFKVLAIWIHINKTLTSMSHQRVEYLLKKKLQPLILKIPLLLFCFVLLEFYFYFYFFVTGHNHAGIKEKNWWENEAHYVTKRRVSNAKSFYIIIDCKEETLFCGEMPNFFFLFYLLKNLINLFHI